MRKENDGDRVEILAINGYSFCHLTYPPHPISHQAWFILTVNTLSPLIHSPLPINWTPGIFNSFLSNLRVSICSLTNAFIHLKTIYWVLVFIQALCFLLGIPVVRQPHAYPCGAYRLVREAKQANIVQ